jgi:microcystin-dependent protein
MPRNGAGVFTLAQPPFQAQAPISSSAVNQDLSDIASGLTDSLPRDGQAGMTDVLPLATRGFTYTADPNTGMSRSGADAQVITCGGTDVVEITVDGVAVTGDVKSRGISLLQVGVLYPWTGLAAPTGFLLPTGQVLNRADYPKLWGFAQTQISGGNQFYNNGNGSTTFGIGDLRGRVIANFDGGTGRLPGYSMGVAGGASDVALNASQLAPHSHSGTTYGMNSSNPHNHGARITLIGTSA